MNADGAPDTVRVEVVPRRLMSRDEAAKYAGISATLFSELVDEGLMPRPIKIRRRVLWDIRRLDAAIDALSDQSDRDSFWDEVAA